ncbi:MAG: hypothetical protein ACXWDM_01520 [Nocardioides sp.]
MAYDLGEIEARSLRRLKYHQTGHPYWANVAEVAYYLGVHQSRVRQLLDQDRMPYVSAQNGRRYVRRHQLKVVANARDQRTWLTSGTISNPRQRAAGRASREYETQANRR